MNDDKRMVENFEVKTSIQIGNKELLYAEDLTANEPYMVCDCKWNQLLGGEVYDEGIASADYLEAMTEFLQRASAAVQQVKEERAERGVTHKPLTASDCIPGSKNAHYADQLVVIKPENMVASARSADHQLLLVTGGNGANPDARGHAVFCTNLFTGKSERWERQDVAGIILPSRIPECVHHQLVKMGIVISKPDPQNVYMASVDHARENGELEAYRESLELNRACAARIASAINDSYKGNYTYDLSAALKVATEEYGMERVQMVVANTLVCKDYDGRFSHVNKEWADSIALPDLPRERRVDFVCEAHPAILDGFASKVQKLEKAEQQEKKPSVMAQLNATAKATKPKTTQAKKQNTAKKQQESR